MERIRLTQTEKKCLKLLNKHGVESLDTIARSQAYRVLRSLEQKDLVKVAWIEGEDYEAVRLSRSGKSYLIENPKLLNPIDWKWIILTIITAIGAITGIVALFIACTRI